MSYNICLCSKYAMSVFVCFEVDFILCKCMKNKMCHPLLSLIIVIATHWRFLSLDHQYLYSIHILFCGMCKMTGGDVNLFVKAFKKLLSKLTTKKVKKN